MCCELLIMSKISWPLWSSVCEYQSVECVFMSPLHSFMMLNCRSHSTVRDGRKATTQTSSSHLRASQTCVRSRSWTLSHTHNTAPSVLACNHPIPSNYNRFVENVRVASRRHIPRGCRTDYVQGLTDESKNLYEAYKQ